MGWQNVWSTERSLGVVIKWTVRAGILGLLIALGWQIAMNTTLDASAVLGVGFDAVGLAHRTSIPWPHGLDWGSGWSGFVRSDRALSALPLAVIQQAELTWLLSILAGLATSVLTAWLLMRSPEMAEQDPDHRRGSVAAEQAELARKLSMEKD